MPLPGLSELTEQRRSAILDAAERIFADKGYHEAGIADIAKELGIGHGTFYRYFRNKHDIAVHILDRTIERFYAIALGEDPESSDTIEQYRGQTDRILTAWIDVAADQPHVARFLHEQAQVVDLGRVTRMRDDHVAFTARFLANGVSKGFLRGDLDVEITAEMLVALIFEGSRSALFDPDPARRVRWKEAGMALMFDGIRGARED